MAVTEQAATHRLAVCVLQEELDDGVWLDVGESGLPVVASVPLPVCVPSSSQPKPAQTPLSQPEPLHVLVVQFGPLQEPVLLSQSEPEHPTLIQSEPEHSPVVDSQSEPSQPDVTHDPVHTPFLHPVPMHPSEIQSSPVQMPFEQPDPEHPNETHRIPMHSPSVQSEPLHWPLVTTGIPVAVDVWDSDVVVVPKPLPLIFDVIVDVSMIEPLLRVAGIRVILVLLFDDNEVNVVSLVLLLPVTLVVEVAEVDGIDEVKSVLINDVVKDMAEPVSVGKGTVALIPVVDVENEVNNVLLLQSVEEAKKVVKPVLEGTFTVVVELVVDVEDNVVLVLAADVGDNAIDVLLLGTVEELKDVVREVIREVLIVPLPATVVSLRPYNAALVREEHTAIKVARACHVLAILIKRNVIIRESECEAEALIDTIPLVSHIHPSRPSNLDRFHSPQAQG